MWSLKFRGIPATRSARRATLRDGPRCARLPIGPWRSRADTSVRLRRIGPARARVLGERGAAGGHRGQSHAAFRRGHDRQPEAARRRADRSGLGRRDGRPRSDHAGRPRRQRHDLPLPGRQRPLPGRGGHRSDRDPSGLGRLRRRREPGREARHHLPRESERRPPGRALRLRLRFAGPPLDDRGRRADVQRPHRPADRLVPAL